MVIFDKGRNKVVEQSPVKISRSQSFEHAQKTSRGLFWSQTGCNSFLEVVDQ